MVSLFLRIQRYGSLYLSATNGNRVREAVIKVKRKPTQRLKHIGRNSMPGMGMSQGGNFCFYQRVHRAHTPAPICYELLSNSNSKSCRCRGSLLFIFSVNSAFSVVKFLLHASAQLLKHFQRGSRHSFGGKFFPGSLLSMSTHSFSQICIPQQERKFLSEIDAVMRTM